MDPIIAFVAALVSLAVAIVLIACAITAARALKRLADEAAHLDAESLSAAAASLRQRERSNAGAAAELLSKGVTET